VRRALTKRTNTPYTAATVAKTQAHCGPRSGPRTREPRIGDSQHMRHVRTPLTPNKHQPGVRFALGRTCFMHTRRIDAAKSTDVLR
jgi:hypothetical protein